MDELNDLMMLDPTKSKFKDKKFRDVLTTPTLVTSKRVKNMPIKYDVNTDKSILKQRSDLKSSKRTSSAKE